MTVVWTTLELIFLFFFFELPPVDDFVKSKYEEHLEKSYQQQQAQNSNEDKQNEMPDKKCVNTSQTVESSNCDDSLPACEQEKQPLLTNDGMRDIQTLADDVTPPPQKFIKKPYWLLNG